MKNENWENYYDVVILPPAPVRDHTIALSRELREHGGAFALGKRAYLPHISLYHLPVRPAQFARFSGEVRDVASRCEGGSLRLRGMDMPLLMTNKPAWLRRLHLEVVHGTQKYFDWGHGAEESWNIERIPSRLQAAARQNLKEFGSPVIGSAFRPHITLTSFQDKTAAKGMRVDFDPMSFEVCEIAICGLGPHHSCQRVLEVFGLKRT